MPCRDSSLETCRAGGSQMFSCATKMQCGRDHPISRSLRQSYGVRNGSDRPSLRFDRAHCSNGGNRAQQDVAWARIILHLGQRGRRSLTWAVRRRLAGATPIRTNRQTSSEPAGTAPRSVALARRMLGCAGSCGVGRPLNGTALAGAAMLATWPRALRRRGTNSLQSPVLSTSDARSDPGAARPVIGRTDSQGRMDLLKPYDRMLDRALASPPP
jgi:hypothetical protein